MTQPNRFEWQIILDFVENVIWPAFDRFAATAAQTTFTMSKAWNVTYDTPLVYVNGLLRTTGTTWGSTTTIVISPAAVAGDHVAIIIRPGAGAGYVPRTGGQLGSDLDANDWRVINLQAASLGHHAVRKDQVEGLATAAGDANYLRRDGTNWPPTVDLAMGGKTFNGLPAAAAATQPVIKSQLDALDVATDGRLDVLEAALSGIASPGSLTLITPTTSTWTVPAGINTVMAILCGGGGGGGGTDDNISGGGGGGAGAVRSALARVTPGAVITYTVGVGGAAGDQGGDFLAGTGGESNIALPGMTLRGAGGAGGGGGDMQLAAGGVPNGGKGKTLLPSPSFAGTGDFGTPGALGTRGGGGGVPNMPQAILTLAGLPVPVGGTGGSTGAGGAGAYGGGGGGSGNYQAGSLGGAGWIVLIWW
jgi:hypothetical protein